MSTPYVRFSDAWWLHPGKLLLLFMLPVYAFVVFVVPALWPDVVVLRARNYLDTETALLGAFGIGLSGVAALVASLIRFRGPRSAGPYHVREGVLIGMGVVTIAAYLVWFWPVIARGELSLDRDELNRTPGVTSFSQFGVPYVVCYLYCRLHARQIFHKTSRVLFYTIIVFTFARVYLWSERLALIELVIPMATLMTAYLAPQARGAQSILRGVRRYGPLLGIPVLFLFFGITEYVRSWTTYSKTMNVSLTDFIVSRVATYYFTALNNGAGLIATDAHARPTFQHVLEPIYKLPLGIGQGAEQAMDITGSPSAAFLERFADVEFNNMSGVFLIFYDLGVLGGMAYLMAFGLVAGIVYGLARRDRPLGIMFLPVLIVACSEILRVLYLHNTRAVLVGLGALVACAQLAPIRRSISDEALL